MKRQGILVKQVFSMFRSWRKRRARRQYMRSAFENEPLKPKGFKWFEAEVQRLIQSGDSSFDFDEAFYLKANPDVAAAVATGDIPCGYIHFRSFGYREQRLYSNHKLHAQLGLLPQAPRSELFKGKNGFFQEPPARCLADLPVSNDLVIFIPHLKRELFFAGYSAFFDDVSPLQTVFQNINIVVLHEQGDPGIEPSIIASYFPNANVLSVRDMSQIHAKPQLALCFNFQTFHVARKAMGGVSRLVYYCQDSEYGFFPFGDDYLKAQQALKWSRNIIASTWPLAKFLQQEGLIDEANLLITAPRIQRFDLATLAPTKKIFCYFRPEEFNARNLAATIVEALQELGSDLHEYEFYCVGTVETSFSWKIGSNTLYVISKLPKERYFDVISSCDAVVALIYSGHPGVIAMQAAASGIPTVTNTFPNRSKQFLKEMSSNIVPYDPLTDSLAICIREALGMEKNAGSFNAALYGPQSPSDIKSYIQPILESELDVAT